MEVTGKLEQKLKLQSGISKSGKKWTKQSFLLRTDEEYSNLYCFDAFGDNVDNLQTLEEGETLCVSFNVNTREYNGKYYTNLSVWKMQCEKPEAVSENKNSDLPF